MRKGKGTVGRVFELPNKEKSAKPFEVSTQVFKELVEIGTTESVSAGAILFRQGQHTKGVFLVLHGRVALSSGDDPVRITRVAEKGSLLGMPASIRNIPYSLTAEAVTGVQYCHLSVAKFRKLLSTNTALGLSVVNILAEEISVLRKLAVYKA
jgi:CRP-like cAMP-binding protein